MKWIIRWGAAHPQPALVDKEHSGVLSGNILDMKQINMESRGHKQAKMQELQQSSANKGANTSNIDCFNGNNKTNGTAHARVVALT